MKIKVWYRITDSGDGSSYVTLYPSEEEAREGLDEDGFKKGAEVPCQVDYNTIEPIECSAA